MKVFGEFLCINQLAISVVVFFFSEENRSKGRASVLFTAAQVRTHMHRHRHTHFSGVNRGKGAI